MKKMYVCGPFSVRQKALENSQVDSFYFQHGFRIAFDDLCNGNSNLGGIHDGYSFRNKDEV